MQEVEADGPLRITVNAREAQSEPLGPVIGQFQLNGDFRMEHLLWALLAEDDAEYLPYHVIERREFSMSWGAQTAGIDILIEVMNNPYVAASIGALAKEGLGAATRRVMERIRSAPLTEDQAIRHATQWLVMSSFDMSADDLTVVGGGVHPKGARWVDLESQTARYRVGVALTKKGGVSVATESWEDLGH
ncbi:MULTISPECIES: hypothetical protein [unclassified Microbacterium]|uniref:hypothetical protein n=1 Tax=unclassified Microbacterium TaxID=2609290 RepID=UPI00049369AA|nr:MULTISPECIES: hypothetical protein [unclassified Microbacterium]